MDDKSTERLEALEQFFQSALPTIQALARLYGPMQRKQPDTTAMYYMNSAYLHVGDVRNADMILALSREKGLIEPEPVVTVEIPDAKLKSRRKPKSA